MALARHSASLLQAYSPQVLLAHRSPDAASLGSLTVKSAQQAIRLMQGDIDSPLTFDFSLETARHITTQVLAESL